MMPSLYKQFAAGITGKIRQGVKHFATDVEIWSCKNAIYTHYRGIVVPLNCVLCRRKRGCSYLISQATLNYPLDFCLDPLRGYAMWLEFPPAACRAPLGCGKLACAIVADIFSYSTREKNKR